MNDYLDKYMSSEGFDLSRLLNDDFFEAIKLLLKRGHYISATKLLLSFVDTIAFVDRGDATSEGFKSWLNLYVDLATLGINADELWEHRNSLLHMTSLDSRKVKSGCVKRLIAYVGELPFNIDSSDFKPYSLYGLLHAIIAGLEKYFEYLKANPSLLPMFIENYDKLLSDCRYEVLIPPNTPKYISIIRDTNYCSGG